MRALGSVLGAVNPILGAVSGGAGLLGSLFGGKQQNKILSQQQQMQKTAFGNLQDQFAKWASTSPQQAAQGVSSIVPTLNQNLVRDIASQTDPATAQAGLAGSPGQLQNNLGLALAPAEQQNQQMAMNLYQWLSTLPSQIAGSEMSGVQNMAGLTPQNTGGAGATFGSSMKQITDWLQRMTPTNPVTLSTANPPPNYMPTNPATWFPGGTGLSGVNNPGSNAFVGMMQ